MHEYNERDERFRSRIKAAVHQLSGQLNGVDSNAAIEAQLSEIAASPLDESEVLRIMEQVRGSIDRVSGTHAGMEVMQNRNSTSSRPAPRETPPPGYSFRRPQNGSAAIVAIATTAICMLTAYGLFQTAGNRSPASGDLIPGTRLVYSPDALDQSTQQFRYVAQPRPLETPPERLIVGQTIRTAARERRRALLPDGSILYLNERSTAAMTGDRTVALHRGQLFVEVTPANMSNQGPFVVETPDRSVTALGTKFAVSSGDRETEVLVTQGKVRVSGASAVITGGQVAAAPGRDSDVSIAAAPRASQALSWTRELIAAAETSLVPKSGHDGGSLIVVDPSGQEMKLSLRKFHVDAHIEDGFARTTIDQTYFNHTHERQEGTFKFPLPPDASLSRLAMYVNGELMEGGMVERDHGRNVFEQIMHTKRDPALLEWVDGSTFKMRVFPLEPRQEKRIVLSYTQRLPSDYDRTTYRFPAGHSLDQVRDWSTRLTIANAAGRIRWFSPTHLLKATEESDDLILEGDLQNAVLDKDLVVELTSSGSSNNSLSRVVTESVAFSGAQHEGHSYQMLRFRPNLSGELERPRRNWVFLYESSGDRNPLLARVQLDVIHTMLKHAEHDDTFSVVNAATRAETFRTKPVRCSAKNIEKAVSYLENAHLVGALNLELAFDTAKPLCRSDDDTYLVHVGSATPVLGERDEHRLLTSLPADVQYVGVGVGKLWSRSFMKSAAGRTGGHFTQINPDEKVSWRAFELLSTLNSPRLIDLKVDSDRKNVRFLTFADTISQGQEIAAITRLPLSAKPLDSVTVTGMLNGKPFTKTLNVTNVAPQADYLPRTWARLEIDRLVASGAAASKDTIIKLSKAMYVMSPFTSLLVLEDEAMYEQFNVDRGRKDHWALYPAPQTIQVVHEPGPMLPTNEPPVDILKRQLKSQRARREVAQANVDLGVRDRRTPDELASLKSLLTQEERSEELLRNRIRLAEELSSRKITSVIDTVLYRRPPTIAVSAAAVYRDRWQRQFANTVEFNSQSDFSIPESHTWWSKSNAQYLNYRGIQPANEHFLWGEGENGNREVSASNINLHGFARSDDFFSDEWTVDRLSRQTIGGTYADHYFDQRVRDFEKGFRMQASADGIVPLFEGRNRQSPLLPTGSDWAIQNGLEPSQGIMSDFITDDLNIDGISVADVRRLTARPNLAVRYEDSRLQFFGGLPTIRGVNQSGLGFRSQRGWISTQDLESLPLLVNSSSSVATLGTSAFDVSEFVIPLLARYDLDFTTEGPILSIPVTPSESTITESVAPVVTFIRQPIEDGYHLEERYGRVPVLDSFYISMNSPDADLDRLVQFETQQREFDVVRRFGFIPQTTFFSTRVARTRIPGRRHLNQVRPAGGIVNVPIRRSGVLNNLLSYATAMQTSHADVLAVVEAESDTERALESGVVDDEARRLIEKARSFGWERIEFVGHDDTVAATVLCNAAGALRIERQTQDGLIEQVVSDGTTLWHLYPELGIGSKRTISRFHRRDLLSMTPWFLPPVEDLASGCNIQFVDRNTIRITPVERSTLDVSSDPDTSAKGDDKSPGKEPIRLSVELVFGHDGRVSERRLVKLPTEEVLVRHVYGVDGSINILDKADKLLASSTVRRKLADAPAGQPQTDGLVILPLPYRSADSYSLVVPAQPAGNGGTDYSQLAEADALKLIATYVAKCDFAALWNVINQRFAAKDDCRMGFAVLLAASATGDAQPIHEVVSHNQGASALGSFLVQHFDWWRDQDLSREFVLPDSASPFIRHLAEVHNMYALWSSGRATRDRTEAQVSKELSRALELIRSCSSYSVAWTLLRTVHKSIDETCSQEKLFARLAAEAASFEDKPGFGSHARLARVQWLISAGRKEQARKLYGEFLSHLTEAGLTPVLSADIRSGFVAQFGNSQVWSEVVLAAARPFAEQQRSMELLQLAQQCAAITDTDTAARLIDQAITGVNLDKRPGLLIAGLRCLITINDWQRAEEFTRRLMRYRNGAEHAGLWRTASQIASAQGDGDESLRRLEQAMRLEFAALPDTVNVESLQREYHKLFDRFTSFAEERLAAKMQIPDDFVERITQSADAWRSIDPDPTDACHRVAKLLQRVGLHDDAWEYWTTPLVNTANSSGAWSNLASALNETNQIQLAGQAWSEAFAAEPTNPELLWKHATMLRSHGRAQQAKSLLKTIAEGKWQPRFTNIQSQARSTLKNL
ncbi:MAG: VIT domain-containing protein [Planctomycetota bacterium]|nr:VIT domain-containing protein [Planctomycetota bacterium]